MPVNEMNVTENTFRRYYRPLCIYALHYVKDADLAEDLVQDCFVSLLESPGSAPGDERAWLYAAVRNRCVDHLRRSPQLQLPHPEDLDGAITDEEAQERSLHEAELWTAIDALPERQRQILLMSKREGKKYREIAQQLGISEKTVEHLVSKALKTLRGKSADFFYSIMFCA